VACFALLAGRQEVAGRLGSSKLYQELGALRQRVAAERQCLPESVLSADAMERLCDERPSTSQDLYRLLGSDKVDPPPPFHPNEIFTFQFTVSSAQIYAYIDARDETKVWRIYCSRSHCGFVLREP
jgi:hypothetical protein